MFTYWHAFGARPKRLLLKSSQKMNVRRTHRHPSANCLRFIFAMTGTRTPERSRVEYVDISSALRLIKCSILFFVRSFVRPFEMAEVLICACGCNCSLHCSELCRRIIDDQTSANAAEKSMAKRKLYMFDWKRVLSVSRACEMHFHFENERHCIRIGACVIITHFPHAIFNCKAILSQRECNAFWYNRNSILSARAHTHTRTNHMIFQWIPYPQIQNKTIRIFVVREHITHSLPLGDINKTKVLFRLTDLIQCAVKSRKWRITVYDACAMHAVSVCVPFGRSFIATNNTHAVVGFSSAHRIVCNSQHKIDPHLMIK